MDRQFSSAISMPVLAGMCEGGVHILSQNVKILTHYFDFLYIDLDYIIISTCHCFVFWLADKGFHNVSTKEDKDL